MAKTNIIPSAPFAISLGGDPGNFIFIEDGKLSFANPEATRIVVSSAFTDSELKESFPTLPRENITVEYEEVLAARGVSQLLTERFILLNLQNKYYTAAMITQNARNNYVWQDSQFFLDGSLADIVCGRHNIDMSDDDLAALACQLEDFRKGAVTDRVVVLSGKDLHLQCDVEVMESLEVVSARCAAKVQEVAEQIREFCKQCKERLPETLYITGKSQLYPDLQNALEKELQGMLPVIVLEHSEDAVRRGMELTLERDRLLSLMQ